MQDIESILKEIGLEIPAGKAEAFQTKFRENYKTVARGKAKYFGHGFARYEPEAV